MPKDFAFEDGLIVMPLSEELIKMRNPSTSGRDEKLALNLIYYRRQMPKIDYDDLTQNAENLMDLIKDNRTSDYWYFMESPRVDYSIDLPDIMTDKDYYGFTMELEVFKSTLVVGITYPITVDPLMSSVVLHDGTWNLSSYNYGTGDTVENEQRMIDGRIDLSVSGFDNINNIGDCCRFDFGEVITCTKLAIHCSEDINVGHLSLYACDVSNDVLDFPNGVLAASDLENNMLQGWNTITFTSYPSGENPPFSYRYWYLACLRSMDDVITEVAFGT